MINLVYFVRLNVFNLNERNKAQELKRGRIRSKYFSKNCGKNICSKQLCFGFIIVKLWCNFLGGVSCSTVHFGPWTFFFVFRKVSYCQKNIKKTLSLKFSLLLFYHKNSRRYERFKQPWLYLILLILDKFSISQSILKVHKRQTTFWKFEKKAHLMLHNLSEAILCTRF